MKKKNSEYFKYLFLLGPMLIIMGITARIVSSVWIPWPLALLISGIIIIALWILLSSNSEKSFWGRRSTQVGTNALIATVAVIAILAMINFLGVRYIQRIDLTENQILTLAPQSQELVRSLKQPLKVWVFVRNQNSADKQLLENYRRYGSNFNYEFVDPQRELALAQKFGIQNSGEVYLESGKKRQLLQTVSETEEESQGSERISEIKLTNGIEKFTSDRTYKVYFVEGHGEYPLEEAQAKTSQALASLQQKNYINEPINLAKQSEIPQDAAVVIIAGAKRNLLEGEVKLLKNYLQRGGSLFVMLSTTNAGLDSLLKDWGVVVDKGLAIDASGKGNQVGLGPETPIVTRYGNHPISKDFGKTISFYQLARPILTTKIKGIEQEPLLITDDQTWAESTPDKEPIEFNPESDRQGPLTLGMALSRTYPPPSASVPPTSEDNKNPKPTNSPQPSPTPTNSPTASPTTNPSPAASPTPTPSPATTENSREKPLESRLVVIGNSNFISDGQFEQGLNGDVFINSISWLSKQDDEVISIRPKEPKNRRINMTPQQAGIVGWTALLILPLLGFITAGIIWWKRR